MTQHTGRAPEHYNTGTPDDTPPTYEQFLAVYNELGTRAVQAWGDAASNPVPLSRAEYQLRTLAGRFPNLYNKAALIDQ
ncbi:MAG TPA: hypothetical protein VJ836_01460 [Candidatus Saccharimonadales bacterium]|nr:hypothetical protein [Candidatus Saccharimonadales bacterium]